MEVTIRSLGERGIGFGTSGVRATVDALTDEVCFAYAAAFLRVLDRYGFAAGTRTVAIGHDLRPSSPRITAACIAASVAAEARVVYCGALPTPALAHFALRRGIPAIVVTGSHIPFDRNGIKFYGPRGEILKEDEEAIASSTVTIHDGLLEAGRLSRSTPLPPVDQSAVQLYLDRYSRFFPAGALRGRRVGVHEHSSVARDVLAALLRGLGAEVVCFGRTDTFVPVDTEAMSQADAAQAQRWVIDGRLDALVSTDGDGDRPLIADDTGAFVRGDVVGMLCARVLAARTVVTPVSSNTAVERCGEFSRVIRTRIGSPYVIAAMQTDALDEPVVGYEANGGVLLGSDVVKDDRSLTALPTRDAALPILALLSAAAQRGSALSELRSELPSRFTASDRIPGFETARSRRLIAGLSSNQAALRAFLEPVGAPTAIDETDGLRVTVATGEIVHLRPSGNAPELRCYAEADTQARANELCRWGLDAAAEASAARP